jgi:epoxyqueuosine reductase
MGGRFRPLHAYFNETFGCGICLAVCPWSTPGRAPKLAERFTRRARDKRAAAPGAEAAA